jgi:hypothetical protein
MIPAETKAAMQGALASMLASCSADGIPNMVFLSQVFYVDPSHVALSFQFFGKTSRNVAENPAVEIRCMDPRTGDRWVLEARFVRRETEGPVFEEMEAQLEVVASLTGMMGVFQLRGADIYEVLAVERMPLRTPDP